MLILNHSIFTLLIVSLSFGLESSSATAAETDPCANPSRYFKGFENRGGKTTDLLNGDIRFVSGTARNLARCEMRGNPAITACLTTATVRGGQETVAVFEIYGWGDQAPKGAVIVPSGRRNTVIDTPASLDAHHGEWNDPLYPWYQAGEEVFISLDKTSGKLMFEAFNVGPVLYGYWGFGLPGGSLIARARFQCGVSE